MVARGVVVLCGCLYWVGGSALDDVDCVMECCACCACWC